MSMMSYRLEPDTLGILRHMGYPADAVVPGDILNEVEKTVTRLKDVMVPEVFYEELSCRVIDYNRVIFGEIHTIESRYVADAFKDCESVIVTVSTLGSRLDLICSGYFDEKEYVAALVADAAGVTALNSLNRVFWTGLAEKAVEKGMGLTKSICPGLGDWVVGDQRILFDILGDAVKGITLNDSHMISPMRSETAVYGMGKGMGISKVHHDCKDCNLELCSFRPPGSAGYSVDVVLAERTIALHAKAGQNLYALLIENKVMVSNACGGNKTCGKCRVHFLEGLPSEISSEENQALSQLELSCGTRLACCVKVSQDMVISLDEDLSIEKILSLGVQISVISQPKIRLSQIRWNPGSINNQRDHAAQILESVDRKDLKMSIGAVRGIRKAVIGSNGILGVVIYDDREVLELTAHPETHKCYGIAVDIGTTTLAATLINQTSGSAVLTETALNPQKQYGGDVISRIHHTMMFSNGLQILQTTIINGVNDLIINLCAGAGIQREQIYELTVAGNTTMLHLMLGVPCEEIAAAPFIPAFTASVRIKALNVGLRINPEGYLVTLPAVSAYIGADTTGAILATGLFQSDTIVLLLDIGTNGEIVLGNKDRIITCSAAAGPAFEGAGVQFGTGGISGAIDHVRLDESCSYTTIGNNPPVGICGSGIIDVISELIRTGLIDPTGRFRDEGALELKQFPQSILERIVRIDGKPAFMIEPEQGIYLTQKDVREIQLAKSAIRSGIEILMETAGIAYSEIDSVYLAGGFGNFMSIESAVRIGLIPEDLKGRCSLVGNAALSGAVMTLMNSEEADRMPLMHKEIEYVEMSGAPLFEEAFIRNMGFGPDSLEE